MKRLVLAGCVVAVPALLMLALHAETVTVSNQSPLVTFRVLFKVGSVHDPAGKEGVASLTAAMLSRGGSREKTYPQIVEAMFPMASSVGAQVDKEMTVFEGTTHRENLDAYYALFRSMLLDPGWRDDDFRRLKDETINFLRIQLRSNNEEELGKEFLYLKIYEGHPYGHHSAGTLASLQALTLDDVKAFYQANYRRGAVVLGLAGCFPGGFQQRAEADFNGRLAEGAAQAVPLPVPKSPGKTRVSIIQKDTRSTALSIGFPLEVTRADPDWPALKLVESYFGQHRSSKSHLFQRIREIRGMNYGDYAYIEYFPRGMFQFKPDPNLGRRQQIFQIWIRPVEPPNGLFALKLALYELNKLVERGLSQEAFDSTKEFLTKQTSLLAQTQSEQLGYALDSQFYGIPTYATYLKDAIGALTLQGVNDTIRRRLRSTNLDVVVIASDAEGLRKAITSGSVASVKYVTPPPADVIAEDRVVGAYRLDAGSVQVVPVASIFEK
jgi:zinc protease